jgi:hypothetical protein
MKYLGMVTLLTGLIAFSACSHRPACHTNKQCAGKECKSDKSCCNNECKKYTGSPGACSDGCELKKS